MYNNNDNNNLLNKYQYNNLFGEVIYLNKGGLYMQYRKFLNANFDVSALGFGCMRLPVINEDETKIDEKEAIRIIRYGIDNGINYIDTAYGYHGGNSEIIVGKALKDGYRDKVKLATKLPIWKVKTIDDADNLLNEQLKKLDVDYIDFYLLHALNKDRWELLCQIDIFSWIDKVKKEGKIKHIGFSFHDDLQTFKKIIDGYDKWEFCQIQYNYLNRNYQAGEEGLRYAYNKGLAVIVMEPLLGGRLAKTPPEAVQKVWDSAKIKRKPVEWGLLWLLNQKEVSLVLSGMSSFEQVKENIEIADRAFVGCLSGQDLETIEQAINAYLSLKSIDCTNCKYCLPCPSNVNIPWNFAIYNESKMYNLAEERRKLYHREDKMPENASNCIKCGICETKCPQHLKIRALLEEVNNFFSK